MPKTPPGMRECPTRVDHAHRLFAHVISAETCEERQRANYHKCAACAHASRHEPAALDPRVLQPVAPRRPARVDLPAPRVPTSELDGQVAAQPRPERASGAAAATSATG